MFNDDISETAPPSSAPCSAVRITPYGDDGPDHDQAVTYRFGTPITFVHVYRTRLPYLGTMLGGDAHPLPGLVGFTAPDDHEEAEIAHAVAQGLWQRRGTYVAVDMWSRGVGGSLYLLVPFWRRLNPDEHPGFAERPGHRTVALGEAVTASRPSRWPRSDSSLGTHAIEMGMQLRLSTDIDPPPPAGFPAPTRVSGLRTAS